MNVEMKIVASGLVVNVVLELLFCFLKQITKKTVIFAVMKNNFLYRSIAFMLAFVVLFTSTGFSMDMHYCQNELKSVSFFGVAPSCHSKEAKTQCPNHKGMSMSQDEDNCCHNETILVESNSDLLSMDFADLSMPQIHFIVAYVHHFIAPFVAPKTVGQHFYLAEPPPPESDFQVRFQSFLI